MEFAQDYFVKETVEEGPDAVDGMLQNIARGFCSPIPIQRQFAKNTISKVDDNKVCFAKPAEDMVEEWLNAAEIYSVFNF